MTHVFKKHLFWTLMVFVITIIGLAPAMAEDNWSIGTPITTYWDGPTLTNAVSHQAINGGFNMVWAHNLAELDVAKTNGLRALYYGDMSETTITAIRNHPALYAYFVKDEPNASEFASLGTTVSNLRTLDPNHMAYINLLPSYATPAQLGTADYQTYVDQYVSTVQPSMLSYDNYSWTNSAGAGVVEPTYFGNLAVISNAAKQAGIPFMNIVQASNYSAEWELPTAGQLRYQANTSLAYGAQAINYFTYMPYDNIVDGEGIAQSDGTTTSIYTALQSINPEFIAVAKILQPLTHVSTGHLGDLPPSSGTAPGASPERLSASSPFQLSGLPDTTYVTGDPVKGAVMGLFGSIGQLSSATHTLVVNEDYSNSLNTTITGPGNLSIYDTVNRNWVDQGQASAALSLAPGSSALVKLTPAATSQMTYTDNFDGVNAATLGANWSDGFWSGGAGYVLNNLHAVLDPSNGPGSSYYNAVEMVNEDYVIASIEFTAVSAPTNSGLPNLWFGLNYEEGAADPYKCGLMVQGTAGLLFAVDGEWRGSSAVALTAGDLYRLTLEQDGADFTGTLADLDGTIVMQYTYTSLIQTSANGYAYFGQGDMWGLGNGSTAWDNFSLTIGVEDAFLLGDANSDGVVSAGDYASVQASFGAVGTAGGGLLGDANGDGVVSAGDYASVQANFGAVAGVQGIPEPATIGMLLVGGLAMFRRKK